MELISNKMMFELLGGKWPEIEGYENFHWDSVDC